MGPKENGALSPKPSFVPAPRWDPPRAVAAGLAPSAPTKRSAPGFLSGLGPIGLSFVF